MITKVGDTEITPQHTVEYFISSLDKDRKEIAFGFTQDLNGARLIFEQTKETEYDMQLMRGLFTGFGIADELIVDSEIVDVYLKEKSI